MGQYYDVLKLLIPPTLSNTTFFRFFFTERQFPANITVIETKCIKQKKMKLQGTFVHVYRNILSSSFCKIHHFASLTYV